MRCPSVHNVSATALMALRSCFPHDASLQTGFLLLGAKVASVRERTIPTERPQLVGKLVPTFPDRGYRVVNATGPYDRILGFLDRSRY
jgi:hypothetical protein